MNTSTQDIQSFWKENGYYHAKGVFSMAEIAELESDFDRLIAQLGAQEGDANARWGGTEMEKLGATNTQILHTHNVQQFSAVWHRALMHPKFLEVASALLGPDIVLHHSKLFQKPPEKGAPFPMHQDWTYFPTELDSMLAAIVHVSRASDEMGCVRVYPRSHKLGRVEGTSGQQPSELLDQHPLDGEGVVIAESEPGDVLFFHYFTLHGSMPNTSQSTRKTVLVQMYAGNDRPDEGMHTDERLVLQGWNSRIERHQAGQIK